MTCRLEILKRTITMIIKGYWNMLGAMQYYTIRSIRKPNKYAISRSPTGPTPVMMPCKCYGINIMKLTSTTFMVPGVP